MIDLGLFGWISWDARFFSGLATIMLVNVVLSGDNAVLIALAVRGLPRNLRIWGIALGSLFAVVLRIFLTAFAVTLLRITFFKLIGGILIACIAVKLFKAGQGPSKVRNPSSVWSVVRVIILADLAMSIENVLAVAGAADGNVFLIIIGLGTTVPLVVGTSALLTVLMDRYPVIVILGAGILGKVAGHLIITDPWIHRHLDPSDTVEAVFQIVMVIAVIALGKHFVRLRERCELSHENSGPLHPSLNNQL